MWPRTIPADVLRDPRRSAEIRVYQQFARVLSDDWFVYYSRPWWGLTPNGGEKDGEADFILLHNLHGLIFVEVKGGGVEFDARSNAWKSVDRKGMTYRIKDPFHQAMVCMHQFMRKFREHSDWPRHRVLQRYFVVLPDSATPDHSIQSIGGHERALACFAQDFQENFSGWIAQRLAVGRERHESSELGAQALQAVDQILTGPVKFSIPIGRQFELENQQMDQVLTGAQLHCLLAMSQDARLLISGGAGAGKTMIAVEFLSRNQHIGGKSLYVCLSKNLADYVSAIIAQISNAEAFAFDQVRDDGAVSTLVVDEAQDIPIALWPKFLERFPNLESLYVFYDSNQAIHARPLDFASLLGAEEIFLQFNLRNTLNIADLTNELYAGVPMVPVGPEGAPVVVSECSATDVGQFLSVILRRLHAEGAFTHQIAILHPAEHDVVDVCSSVESSGFGHPTTANSQSGGVVVCSVPEFKGLEREIVILIADRSIASSAELSYVAVSRARNKLIVIGEITEGPLKAALSAISS